MRTGVKIRVWFFTAFGHFIKCVIDIAYHDRWRKRFWLDDRFSDHPAFSSRWLSIMNCHEQFLACDVMMVSTGTGSFSCHSTHSQRRQEGYAGLGSAVVSCDIIHRCSVQGLVPLIQLIDGMQWNYFSNRRWLWRLHRFIVHIWGLSLRWPDLSIP